MSRLVRGVAAMAVAAALVVSGCSGDDDGGGSSIESTTTSAAPQQGGVLRLGLERPDHLDPALARSSDRSELLLADLLFDGLTSIDPVSGEAVPALAASWGSSLEQTRWELRLRSDAMFANGRVVTAADVKYSLERVARQGSGSEGSVLLETIRGYTAFAVDGTATGLAGVSAPEVAVVVIELDEPLSTLPAVLSNPVFGIVPSESVEAATPAFDTQPVGSGPFAVSSRDDESLTLARAAGSAALLDGVEVRLYDDLDAAYEGFKAGDVDVSPVPPEAPGGGSGEVVTTPFQAELFYGLNLASPKLADARFRAAIIRAIDRRAIIDSVYDGVLAPLAGVVPSGVPGHQDDPCGQPCDHDVEAARALLAEAFPEGGVPELFIDFDEGARQAAVATAIRDDLAEAGVPATLRPRPFEEYKSFVASGEQEVFRLGWTGGYPSPGAYLAPLFRSDAPDNVMRFSDAEVDGLLDTAASASDAVARAAAYADAERRIMAAVPLVPVGQFVSRTAVAPEVQGLAVSVAGTFDASTVWLSD